jgi:AcrR family transcriptional regulator
MTSNQSLLIERKVGKLRISKKPEERKIEIMDTAMKLFMENGFEETAVSEIVKTVSISQGAFYYYFKSKEEILDAIIQREVGEIIEELRLITQDPTTDTLGKLRKSLKSITKAMRDYILIAQYLHRNKYNLLHLKLVDMFIDSYAPILALLIKQGKEEGIFQTEYELETASVLLIGMGKLMHDHGFQNWSCGDVRGKLEIFEYILGKMLGIRKDVVDFESILADVNIHS